MKRRGKNQLPRYTRPKRLSNGQTAYFFEVPKIYRDAVCPVSSEALGTDYVAACRRVNEILLPAFDSWRTMGAQDLVPARASPGIFDWLVMTFKQDRRYREKDARTRRSYDQGLALVASRILKNGRHFGALRLESINQKAADRLYESIRFVSATVEEQANRGSKQIGTKRLEGGRERRATANAAMRACRRAWNVVGRTEPKLVPANPCAKMGLVGTEKGKTPTATYQELRRFVDTADRLGLPSLGTAALIAWEWLPRGEDVFRTFSAEHYRPSNRSDAVRIIHSKTDQDAWIPLYNEAGKPLFPELMERLDAIKQERPSGLMLLRDHVDRRAKIALPWPSPPKSDSDDGLGYMRGKVREVVQAAGMRSELSFRSFRHGGITEAGEAGLSDREIQAQTRHRSAEVLPTYAKRTQVQVANGAEKRLARRDKHNHFSEQALG